MKIRRIAALAATVASATAGAVAVVALTGSAGAAEIPNMTLTAASQSPISGGGTGFGADMVMDFTGGPQGTGGYVATFTVPDDVAMISSSALPQRLRDGTILQPGPAQRCDVLPDHRFQCHASSTRGSSDTSARFRFTAGPSQAFPLSISAQVTGYSPINNTVVTLPIESNVVTFTFTG